MPRYEIPSLRFLALCCFSSALLHFLRWLVPNYICLSCVFLPSRQASFGRLCRVPRFVPFLSVHWRIGKPKYTCRTPFFPIPPSFPAFQPLVLRNDAPVNDFSPPCFFPPILPSLFPLFAFFPLFCDFLYLYKGTLEMGPFFFFFRPCARSRSGTVSVCSQTGLLFSRFPGRLNSPPSYEIVLFCMRALTPLAFYAVFFFTIPLGYVEPRRARRSPIYAVRRG